MGRKIHFVLNGHNKKPRAYLPDHDFIMERKNYQGLFQKKGMRMQTVQKVPVGRSVFCAQNRKSYCLFHASQAHAIWCGLFFWAFLVEGVGKGGELWDEMYLLSQTVGERTEGARNMGGDVNAGTAQRILCADGE